MRLEGNGQGWLVTYSTSVTAMPASSSTSRTTACSALSPGSTKPASVEKRPSRPAGLAAEHAPVGAVVDEHDDGRVGAREVVAAVGRQRRTRPAAHDLGRRAAARAARVGGVPVGQPDGVHEQAGVVVVEQHADLAQPEPAGAERARRRSGDGEHRAVVVGAEVEPVARRARRRSGPGRAAAGPPRGRRRCRPRRPARGPAPRPASSASGSSRVPASRSTVERDRPGTRVTRPRGRRACAAAPRPARRRRRARS